MTQVGALFWGDRARRPIPTHSLNDIPDQPRIRRLRYPRRCILLARESASAVAVIRIEIVNSFSPTARRHSLNKPPQILKKIFLRYIQNRMNQKISSTADP